MKKYLKNLFLGLAQSDRNYGLTRNKTNRDSSPESSFS